VLTPATASAHGDWFIDLFTGEAEKIIEHLAGKLARRQFDVEPYWWVPGLPSPSDGGSVVAAVDGGGGIIPLAGGGALYVARAYGYVEGSDPERLLELRFYGARDTRVLDALRSWVEHRVAVRLALRLPPGSILLMDGSLWATITSSLLALIKLARGTIHSLGGVYTALLSGYTLAEIVKLVEVAEKQGIVLAYVSKDHSYRALKEKVLLEHVAKAAPSLEQVIASAIEWYPLNNRDILLEARRLVPEAYRAAYDAALDPSYRDTLFLQDTVGQAPGYTWQLTLPPPRNISQALMKGGPRGLAERAAEKTRQLIPGEPEVAEMDSLAERLPKTIDSLPGVRMQYIRFSPQDNPVLVEQPEPTTTYHTTGRILVEPNTKNTALIAQLAKHYAGPEYYNIPLIAAHINATLHTTQLEAYTRLLEQLAATRGLKLATTRRTRIATKTRKKRRKKRLFT
jgi:hypothetical protein